MRAAGLPPPPVHHCFSLCFAVFFTYFQVSSSKASRENGEETSEGMRVPPTIYGLSRMVPNDGIRLQEQAWRRGYDLPSVALRPGANGNGPERQPCDRSKNPDFLPKNPDFKLENPDFTMEQVQGGTTAELTIADDC